MTPPTYKFGYWNAEFRPVITLEHCPENKHHQVWIQDEMHVVYRVGDSVFRPVRGGTGNILPMSPKQLTLVEQPHRTVDFKQLPSYRIIMSRMLHTPDPTGYLWFHVDGRWYSARCDLGNKAECKAGDNVSAFTTAAGSPIADRFVVTDYVAVWQTTHLKVPVKPDAAVPSWMKQADTEQQELNAALEDIRSVAVDDVMRREVDSQERPVAVG